MVMNRLLSQLALVVTFANELGGDAYDKMSARESVVRVRIL